MIVIADNSPLSALAEIGRIDILRALYGRIIIPASVAFEAAHPRAPQALRVWIASNPEWLELTGRPRRNASRNRRFGRG